MDIETLASAPKIVQKQAIGAIEAAGRDAARWSKIRDLVIGKQRGYLASVIELDIDPDSTEIDANVYAIEVGDRGSTTWTTLVAGRTDHMHFDGPGARWRAILHAIAQVHDQCDTHATASFYAARVLGIPEKGAS